AAASAATGVAERVGAAAPAGLGLAGAEEGAAEGVRPPAGDDLGRPLAGTGGGLYLVEAAGAVVEERPRTRARAGRRRADRDAELVGAAGGLRRCSPGRGRKPRRERGDHRPGGDTVVAGLPAVRRRM